MTHQKDAVGSGYWPLYRYHPSPQEGAHPFQLDSKPPTTSVSDFALAETRFSMLARSDPERSRHLLAMAQSDVTERWRYYEQLAHVERALPHDDGELAVAPADDADQGGAS